MKLFIDYSPNTSGKGKFLNRLIPELENNGVRCRFKPGNCDIALGVSWWRTKVKYPMVLRVDGIHLKQNDKTNWKNDRIRKALKRTTAVIYQSEYAKKMVQAKFGFRNKPSYVVFNGAVPSEYWGHSKQLKGKYNIISVAKWCHRNGYRTHKRFKSVVATAREYRDKDVHFYVAGEVLDKPSLPNLTLLGQLDDKTLRGYLCAADIMFYPAKYDWCPNSVVEAICAGLPVIATDGHGGTELVRACGGVVISNKFSVDEVCENIAYALAEPPNVDSSPVDVKNTAVQYKAVFEEVLNG